MGQSAGRWNRTAGVWGIVAGVVLWSCEAGAAGTVYVDAAGSCAGKAPCFTTIQAGVNHAGPDDPSVVIVIPGTYPESVDLSLMGSAIASSPRSIIITQVGIAEALGFLSSAAMPGSMPQALASTEMEASMAKIESGMAALSAQIAAVPAVAGGALGTVLVQPAAGPAFFNSMVPFPGAASLWGIDVLSPDDDGVRLNATGSLQALLVNASGNDGDGLDLTSGMGDVGTIGCIMNMNGGNGVLARAGAGILVFNSIADANMVSGMDLDAVDQVSVSRLPTAGVTGLTLPATVSASRNKGVGLAATSTSSGVTIVDFEVFVTLTGGQRTLHFDENMSTGVQVSAPMGTFNFGGLTANGNQGLGFGIEASADDMTGIFADANGNAGTGISLSAKTLFALRVGARENLAGGWAVSATGAPNDAPISLYPTAATLLSCSADRNTGRGFAVATPASGATLQAVTAIGNTTDGIALTPLAGSASDLRGGIICENGSSGIRLLSNATANAEGNWWGSPAGPFHAAKNGGGAGNSVVDATNGGGAGDVDFLPFIDTVTATAASAHQGIPSPVRFQFSGGGGTVFLGLPNSLIFGATGPGSLPPFSLMTDNGVLAGPNGFGATVNAFIDEDPGTVAVALTAFKAGTATVTLEGPCGLAGTVQVAIGPTPAPALSALGLLAAILALSAVACAAIRRAAGRDEGLRSQARHPIET